MNDRRLKLSLVTLAVAAALVGSGCSNDQYAVEQRFWRAQKQAERIFRNAKATPPKALAQTIGMLNTFAHAHPQSNMALEAELTIARLYLVKEEYEKGRRQLRILLDKYQKSATLSSTLIFLLGNSYELEDKWPQAIEEYRQLMLRYPMTLRGLTVPIYIAQHYKVTYQPDKMIAAYQEAISHYQGLIERYPVSPLSYQAYSLIAQCYVSLKEWRSAITTFQTMLTTYRNKVPLDGIYLSIAMIYKNELKDTAQAKAALTQMMSEYPTSRLCAVAKSLLAQWEKQDGTGNTPQRK